MQRRACSSSTGPNGPVPDAVGCLYSATLVTALITGQAAPQNPAATRSKNLVEAEGLRAVRRGDIFLRVFRAESWASSMTCLAGCAPYGPACLAGLSQLEAQCRGGHPGQFARPGGHRSRIVDCEC